MLCTACETVLSFRRSGECDPRVDLVSWSRLFIEALNARNFAHPVFRYAAPDLEGRLDAYCPTYSAAEAIDTFRDFLIERPSLLMEIENTNIITDLENGAAEVFIDLRMTEGPSGVARQSMAVFTWRLESESWRCVSHCGMRAFKVIGFRYYTVQFQSTPGTRNSCCARPTEPGYPRTLRPAAGAGALFDAPITLPAQSPRYFPDFLRWTISSRPLDHPLAR